MNMLLTLLVLLRVDYTDQPTEKVIYFDRIQINEVYDPPTGNSRLDQLIFEDWRKVLCPNEDVPGLYQPKWRFMVEHWIMLPDDARDESDAEDKKKWEAALTKYLSGMDLMARAEVRHKYKYPGKYVDTHRMHPRKTADGFYTVRVPKGWRNPSPASVAGDTTREHIIVKAKILIHTRTMYDPEAAAKKEFPLWERRLFVRPKLGPHIWQR